MQRDPAPRLRWRRPGQRRTRRPREPGDGATWFLLHLAGTAESSPLLWCHHPTRGPAVRARASMSKPEPLYLRWRGQDVRVHHDDARLTRYSPVMATLQSAMTITTEVATLGPSLRLGP